MPFSARAMTAGVVRRGHAGGRHLPEGVHAGVGAAGAVDRHGRAVEPRERVFEQALDRHAARLPLPADVRRPVVRQRDLQDAVHGRHQ